MAAEYVSIIAIPPTPASSPAPVRSTIFEDLSLQGVVDSTLIRGVDVYLDDAMEANEYKLLMEIKTSKEGV